MNKRITSRCPPLNDKDVEFLKKSTSIVGDMAFCNHIAHLIDFRSKIALDILRCNSVGGDLDELLELYQNINSKIAFDLNFLL